MRNGTAGKTGDRVPSGISPGTRCLTYMDSENGQVGLMRITFAMSAAFATFGMAAFGAYGNPFERRHLT